MNRHIDFAAELAEMYTMANLNYLRIEQTADRAQAAGKAIDELNRAVQPLTGFALAHVVQQAITGAAVAR
ncbi:hypothetical protein FIONNBHARTH_58 [Mycobacterium phage Fionnbharth]|uniref:Uncharacterized protein n=2 Tax=Fionnbharthvirus TaxID=2948708 RepID=A0A6G6XSM9_9CAUD|nr:hypothetical protein ACQ59_gp75 [Mycobacterium phage Fionnbharth]YP_009950400.1 hypothetical protein I5G69_gp77 [Mycobacterium phage Eponine]AER26349.1 hypothetical protein FIONNBHARTH_58 [Mycobacterium phage Fionnbharth]QIG61832.1 hypothetical protein SEA_EPONINE_60 [Mycobacterium phage Eponine]